MKKETRPRPWATKQHSLCSSPGCLLSLPRRTFPETLKMGKQATISARHSDRLIKTTWQALPAAGQPIPIRWPPGVPLGRWKNTSVAIHPRQCAEGHEVRLNNRQPAPPTQPAPSSTASSAGPPAQAMQLRLQLSTSTLKGFIFLLKIRLKCSIFKS